MTDDISAAIVELERDRALAAVTARAEGGEDPTAILEQCRQGMTIVGQRFQQGDYFLAELMLSAEIFKGAMAILEPYLSAAQPAGARGTVLLATLRGDIHDLGKNIFAVLLRAHGFQVHDLGVDVNPSLVVESIKQTGPDLVGFSALITTAFDSMKQTTDMLQQAGLRGGFRLMVGGGVTSVAVRDYIGADFQTTDATEGVAYCIDAMEGK